MELDKPITIAVILFIILVLSFYVVLPKYQELQGLLIKLGEKEAEFIAKSAHYIEITSVYKELMLYKDNLAIIDTALPKKFSLANTINFLYKKSTEDGLILGNVSASNAGSVGTNTGVKETSVSLQLFGSYASLEKFINFLENSARLIEGENVTFSVSPPNIDNPQPQQNYPISLEIKVYSY